MFAEQFVKQDFISILKHRETNISSNVVVVVEDGSEDSLCLLIYIVAFSWKQSFDTELAAFFVGERCTFVVQGIAQQVGSTLINA
jgi:hypothetical protein